MTLERRSADKPVGADDRLSALPRVTSPIWGWLLVGAALAGPVAIGWGWGWKAGGFAWWASVAMMPLVQYLLERLRGVPHYRADWGRRSAVCVVAGGVGVLSVLTEPDGQRLALSLTASLITAAAVKQSLTPAGD